MEDGPDNQEELNRLLARLKDGDNAALAELFTMYRVELKRMVDMRLDPRLNGRISSSDVLQDAYLDALQRVGHYFEKPEMPFHVWLRLVASQRIVDVHRQHLGAKMRSVNNEVSMEGSKFPQVNSSSLARCLAAQLDSPSQVAMRKELLAYVEDALGSMDPLDREVLSLRHFEEMTNDQVASYLGLQKAAASNRYVRALKKLKEILAHLQNS